MKLIDCYTREQMIEDGQLYDISKLAKEMGFKCPIAVTSAAWSLIKNIPEKFKWQDLDGRTWDVLSVLFWKAKTSKESKKTVLLSVKLPHEVTSFGAEDGIERKELKLYAEFKAVAGSGDNGELVITIMLPEED